MVILHVSATTSLSESIVARHTILSGEKKIEIYDQIFHLKKKKREKTTIHSTFANSRVCEVRINMFLLHLT